jgi:hypothetical protein
MERLHMGSEPSATSAAFGAPAVADEGKAPVPPAAAALRRLRRTAGGLLVDYAAADAAAAAAGGGGGGLGAAEGAAIAEALALRSASLDGIRGGVRALLRYFGSRGGCRGAAAARLFPRSRALD